MVEFSRLLFVLIAKVRPIQQLTSTKTRPFFLKGHFLGYYHIAMLEYEIFEGNFQTLLSRCVLGKTFLPLFLCHCLDTNTGEVGIAPRTAAIAVLTSQTVAEELDYLRTSTAKLRLPMQTPSSRSQKAATKHAIRRYFYSFFFW